MTAEAADLIARGESKHMRLLLEHLYGIWIIRSNSVKLSTKSINNKSRNVHDVNAVGKSEQSTGKKGSEISDERPSIDFVRQSICKQHNIDATKTAAIESTQDSRNQRVPTSPKGIHDCSAHANSCTKTNQSIEIVPSALLRRDEKHSIRSDFIQKYLPLKLDAESIYTECAARSHVTDVFDSKPYGTASISTYTDCNAERSNTGTMSARSQRMDRENYQPRNASVNNSSFGGDNSDELLKSYHPSSNDASRKVRFSVNKTASHYSNAAETSASNIADISVRRHNDRDEIRSSFTFIQATPPGNSTRPFSTSFIRHLPCHINHTELNRETVNPSHAPSYDECLLVADWLAFIGVKGEIA